MTEPTPRPWEAKDGHMVIEPGLMTPIADCAISDYEDEDFGKIMRRAKANAEYIVRCVNAHQALLEYVQHRRGCITEQSPFSAGANGACDCGLGQILAECES